LGANFELTFLELQSVAFLQTSHIQSTNKVLQVRKEITTLGALGAEQRGAKIAKNANFQIDIARDRK